MKLYLSFLFIPLLLLFSSCTKSVQEVTPNQTIVTSIARSAWATSDSGKTYSTTISMPEIDDYFNKYGAVLVYATFDGTTYEQIPEVYSGVAYSFSHSVGKITIDIQASDGVSTVTPPGSIIVKIVLITSAL
ncbi:hypothetical protein [Mucilaginibacter paludis]|uniref:Uncharacterized protein n=1 Tax=Mucilaginibacter paludis DSM 18603 TaxID=714943 RepID=H1Y061_9SPHI|nr:hypothetical protein [Mucilaginibacter paludis]EHQ27970.1 hypothetical protein Mucpa_3878 [Mucilaginibacter paludis DSM 18603]